MGRELVFNGYNFSDLQDEVLQICPTKMQIYLIVLKCALKNFVEDKLSYVVFAPINK